MPFIRQLQLDQVSIFKSDSLSPLHNPLAEIPQGSLCIIPYWTRQDFCSPSAPHKERQSGITTVRPAQEKNFIHPLYHRQPLLLGWEWKLKIVCVIEMT